MHMATAIACLKDNPLGYFIWGYMKLFIEDNLSKSKQQYYGDLNGFARRNIKEDKNPNYDEIKAKVDKKAKELDTKETTYKLKIDESEVGFKKIILSKEDYIRVGPFQISGANAVGLKEITVVDQNKKDITKSVELIRYKDEVPDYINIDEIKDNHNFYICIPKDKGISSFTATIKGNKTKIQIPVADIYFLDCNKQTWQNLVVTEGKIKEKTKSAPVDNVKITMPAELTIIKKDATTETYLQGAQFVIFRYVKADGGTWYKKGDTYTQKQEEATDKKTTYKREYVHKEDSSHYTYDRKALDDIKNNGSYLFTTNSSGKIELLLEPGTYYAKEMKAPEGYKMIEDFFKVGKINALEKTIKMVNNEPNKRDKTDIEITKVDQDNHAVVLKGVRFRFHSEKHGWLKEISKDKYDYVANENDATWFETDDKGKIYIKDVYVDNYTYKEDSNSVPLGYDITGKEQGDFKLANKATNSITIENKQVGTKISGYVWVDKIDGKDSQANHLYKTSTGSLPDTKDLLLDGITVKLKDRTQNGQTVMTTTTSQLNRYTDSVNNGHGEYLFQNVKADKLEDYYVEFEYDGLTYTNVTPLNQNNGSKAAEDTETRDRFNQNFSVIEGGESEKGDTGITRDAQGNKKYDLTYRKNEEEKTATLISQGNYEETDSYIKQNGVGNYPIIADTKVTGYNMKNNFDKEKNEVRYVNLGLRDRNRPDITLGKDLQNVKVSVNGHEHTYQYDKRYDANAAKYDGQGFNVGVKFQSKYTGTYSRAMYQSDYLDNTNNINGTSKELQVYVTYKLKMLQANQNLKAQVNSIVDYYDTNYEIDKAYRLDEQGREIEIGRSNPIQYNDKYKKVILENNTKLMPQTEQEIYVRFKLSRQQVLSILRDKGVGEKADELLYNVAEINSYSIFDNQDKPYAGIDIDSNPGNTKPEDIKTYEDDTDASPALQLEVAQGREMTGKVFIDNHVVKNNENPNGVMTGIIRQGNGKYDNGEATVKGVTVTLTENNRAIEPKTVTTNDSGDFYLSDYIPGDYTLTYTWGGQTYTLDGQTKKISVQEYKGTVYDNTRNQNDKKWWYVARNPDGTKVATERLTDAIDNYNTAQNAPKGSRTQIDAEIREVNKDTMAKVTRTQMDSTTPTMEIGVEYDSTYSDATTDKFTYSIDNIDFGIIQRPKQNLMLKKRVKTMKVTLANGQVIANLTIDENGNVTGDNKGVTYMRPSANTNPNNGFIRLELDNELIQGTKLEVEYEIKATNNSELDYMTEEFYKYGTNQINPVTIKPTAIIDYLDKSWSFDSKDTRNTAWQLKQVKDIHDLVVPEVYQGDNTAIGNKTILYTEQLQNEKLQPNQSSTPINIAVSKILTTTDEISLDNEAEEVKVSKTGGAILQTTPGNYVPGLGITEADDSMAETAIVTPATGENQNYILPIIVGTTALIILGAGVIIIKKKVT